MPLRPPTHPSLTQIRTFTHTSSLFAKSTKQRLAYEHADVPPYPYGPSAIYKQSNFGLYGLQKIRFGNKVSEKNEIKTRRHWRPNVHLKRLWSDSLGETVRVRVTTRVLKTIDKVGGLDEYLLGEKSRRIKELGMGGWKLRWRIMQTEKVKQRFRSQREAFGLRPKKENMTFAEATEDMVKELGSELGEGELAEVEEGMEEEIGEFMHEEPQLQKEDKVVV